MHDSIAKMHKHDKSNGFSLVELAVVLAVSITLAALAIPSVASMVYSAKLRNAAADFSSIVQQSRSRAVQDSRFYSVYFEQVNGAYEAFVNIYPQNNDGTSGSSGGSTIDPKDPLISWESGVTTQPQSSAPSANALKALFLPSSSSATLSDGSSSTSPITFGPMGIPCTPTSATGGTICNTASGPVAFWVFFQSSRNQQWEAVTVTPAGKIQKWSYSGTTWAAL